jgi:hypothetical protein
MQQFPIKNANPAKEENYFVSPLLTTKQENHYTYSFLDNITILRLELEYLQFFVLWLKLVHLQ